MPAEVKDLKDVTFKNTQTRTTRKWKMQQQELEFRITERPHWGGIHCREEQNEMFRCLEEINAKIGTSGAQPVRPFVKFTALPDHNCKGSQIQ